MSELMTKPSTETSVPSQRKGPPALRSHSLLGSASEMQRDPLGFLTRTHQYGDVVRMRFVFSHAYLVYHPDEVKRVLQENHRNYNKDLFTYKLLRPFLGAGLLINDGEPWLHQRRLMQPAFHRRRLATYGALMTEAASAMLERWQARANAGASLNTAEEMMRLTLRIVGQALFSMDLSDETTTVSQAVTTLLALIGEYVYAPFPPYSVPTPRNRRAQEAIRMLDQVVYGIINERRQHNRDTGDLLSMLILARDEETGQGMNNRQVRDEVMTLLTAGHETTANALTWTWYLLSQHADVERRLHDELNEVLGERLATVDDLANLSYTRMILEESLRLYPPVCVFSRKAIAEDNLRGYAIPANSMVVLSPYATHRHPAVWERPEEFEPERFTPERSASRPRFAYFPFGGGPRLCIGGNFALMEAQLILATVAQRYRLRLVPGHTVEPQFLVTLRPRYGMPMTLHRR